MESHSLKPNKEISLSEYFYNKGLKLETDQSLELSTLFLGPKGENEKLLKDLIDEAIKQHCESRRTSYKNDPPWITPAMQSSDQYKKQLTSIKIEANRLNETLSESIPFYSYRYCGHMLWDITIPGLIGYISAIFHNQNNVAIEASPVTSYLEDLVGNDLCKLVGYETKGPSIVSKTKVADILAWGHLTSCGSLANIEALLAARNLKYLPLSIYLAIKNDNILSRAKELKVTIKINQSFNFMNLSVWDMLNLPIDEILQLESKVIKLLSKHTPEEIINVINKYKIQNIGILSLAKQFHDTDITSMLCIPKSAHYSWDKGMSISGMGKDSATIRININNNASINIKELREVIEEAYLNKKPIFMIVLVLGSTEEGSVDNVEKVFAIRERYRERGFEFWIHIDAAWGGYFAFMAKQSFIEKFDSTSGLCKPQYYSNDLPYKEPLLCLKTYVKTQYDQVKKADSITIDPHKAGFIPYPAGALCFRNKQIRDINVCNAPIINHNSDEADYSLGVYTIEGSRPGAAAASVYLSHKVLGQTGYAQLLSRCMWNAKRFYFSLLSINTKQSRIFVKTIQKLNPSLDFSQKLRNDQIAKISELNNSELFDYFSQDRKAKELFIESGPDLLITSFAFNFYDENGCANSNIDVLNLLNEKIYKLCSQQKIIPELNTQYNDLQVDASQCYKDRNDLYITSSQYKKEEYENENNNLFINDFVSQLIEKSDPDQQKYDHINFLICTIMDPWMSDTSGGNYIPKLIDSLQEVALKALHEVLETNGI